MCAGSDADDGYIEAEHVAVHFVDCPIRFYQTRDGGYEELTNWADCLFQADVVIPISPFNEDHRVPWIISPRSGCESDIDDLRKKGGT